MIRSGDTVQRYLETMRQGFGSDAEMEDARLALAQSMRDRGSRDQDEAARALREVAAELRANGSPVGIDTAGTMELAATLRRSS
jgi:hypothetical protein